MGARFTAPEGKLRSNLGLLAGTVIRELRMHPFLDDGLEETPRNFRPEWLEFTVLSIVDPQLHGYVGIKFCEEGRKAYCLIWRAKGVQQNVSSLDTFPETEENRPGSGAAVQS